MGHHLIVDPEDFVNVEASAVPGRWEVRLWPADEGQSLTIDSHRTKASADAQADAIRTIFVSWLHELDHEVTQR